MNRIAQAFQSSSRYISMVVCTAHFFSSILYLILRVKRTQTRRPLELSHTTVSVFLTRTTTHCSIHVYTLNLLTTNHASMVVSLSSHVYTMFTNNSYCPARTDQQLASRHVYFVQFRKRPLPLVVHGFVILQSLYHYCLRYYLIN